MNSFNRTLVLFPVLAAMLLAGFWLLILPDSLVVYCAHDAEYSQEILNEFSRQTGISVEVRFDTEATKSLGLINQIIQEQHRPRCDVFWNNELLGMEELRQQKLLEPYQGNGWKRIPEQFRDPEGHWVGFAARMRVFLLHGAQSNLNDAEIQSIINTRTPEFSLAKPLFGTTLTQFTVMRKVWGDDSLRKWFAEIRTRGSRIVNGNASVKDIVAEGICRLGMTDTDDAFVAIDDRHDVTMRPIRIVTEMDSAIADQQHGLSIERGKTICIPNTVGIVKGTKRRSAAEKLVDFLASEQTELALAKAKSRQIPLGPVDSSRLPNDVKDLAEWAKDGFDLRPLLPERRDCLQWLSKEFLQ